MAVSAAGALALVAASGVADAAAACPTPTITGGTGTVFMMKAYIANMATNNILITAQNPISVVTTPPKVTITTWTILGGNADLSSCTGFVYLHAGSLVANTATGQSLLLDDITWNVANGSLDYTVHKATGDVILVGLRLAGHQWGTVHGRTVTYHASELLVDRTAAAKMDAVLGTNAFVDTKVFGAFSTTFELSRPAAHSGRFDCATS